MALRMAKTLAGGLAGMALALACAQAAPASAATSGGPLVIHWTIDGTFSDGGIFFGTFTYDGLTDSVTKWNVTTTTPTSDPDYTTNFGTALLSGFPPGVAFIVPVDSVTTDTFQMFFPLEFDVAADIFGYEAQQIDVGSIALVSIIHTIDSGTAVGVATPEPATWAMMIVGFGLAGMSLRRRPRLALAKV